MNALRLWRRERLPLAVFGPVSVALAVAAAIASGSSLAGPAALAACAGAVALVTQFRLWDDLADRDHDQTTHPGRAMVRHPRAPFVTAVLSLGVFNVVALAALGSWTSSVALAALDLAFWLAYRLRRSPRAAAWRFVVLPLKYPAFVAVLATAMGTPAAGVLAPAAVLAYAAAGLYEWLHDRPLVGATS
jgi:hypothetical protein